MVLRRTGPLALLAGAGLAALSAGAASAQSTNTSPLPTQNAPQTVTPEVSPNAPAQPTPQQAATGNDDIVVTAQKRSENAQNVPIAITALNNDQLRSAGVSGTEDLKFAVPSLNITVASAGFGLPRIRGLGSTGSGPGIENPVAIYVDGVYYGAAFGILQSLYDTEQVAVLKGPQGTLFGRNATGGLIQISTLGPSFQPTARAEFGYGNYDTVTAAGYISGGLSRTVAISLSGQYENRNQGYGRNLFTGGPVQDGRFYAVRAKLLWQPSDATKFLFSIDNNGRVATEPAYRTFSLNALGQNVTNQVLALGGDPNHDTYSDLDPISRAFQWGTSLTFSQDFGGVALKSITAYRRTNFFTIFDPDGTTLPRTIINNTQFDRQFSEELNLVSDGHHKVDWVIGAYYLHDRSGLNPARTTGLTVNSNGYSDYFSNLGLNSYAGFAEGTLHLGDSTSVIAGVRYTSDHRTDDARSVNVLGTTGALTSVANSASRTFNKLTYRLSVDHRFSPELLVYASYNRGFRSGSYIPQTNPPTALEPETDDAYEVGFKSDLLDRKVRFNLAGYYYGESNIQVFQIISGQQFVYNAQGAHIYGVDSDVNIKVTRDLRVFGGFNYTHARYTTFNNAIIAIPYPLATGFVIPAGQSCLGTFGNPFAQLGGNCLLLGSASGNRLQNTPTFTFSAGGSWDVATSLGKFTIAGNYYHNSGFVGTADERLVQPAYDTVDASVTLRFAGDKFFVRAWSKNLTNTFFRTQLGASNSGDNGTYGPPRTFGGTVGFDF